MSSSIDERPTVPEEMNLSYRQDNATTRHVECRSALDVMSPKFPAVRGSYAKCNDHGAFSRTVSSGKNDNDDDADEDDDVVLVATLRSEPDNAARLSWNALPSSSAFSTDRCSSSQEHDRPVYNDSTMKHRSRSPRRECDARIYSHLFSSIYSITKKCYRRLFRSHSLWRYDHPRGIDFSRIFLSFVCVLFLMMHMTVHADSIDSIATIDDTDFIDTYTPISKKPCVQGLSTPGVTRPYGDINIEYGTRPLRIMCILDPKHVAEKYPGKTSADLYFLRNAVFIDKKYISIINETAILLEIHNPEPSKDLYTCGLRVDDNKFHSVAVCLNEVAIGHKPTEPISFNCVSDNWESLRCSWVPVHNYVKTTYNLTFTLPGKRSRKIFPCPKDINDINETNKDDTKKLQDIDKNSCYWDTKTNPIYRQPYEVYTFILFAFNPFENASFTYKIDHFSNVIPHSPWNAKAFNVEPGTVKLQWSLPFPLQNFPAGVHHRIMYQNQLHSNSKNATWTVINITDKVREEHKEYFLKNLDCGYCEFDVRILLKSATAEDVERMWSKPAVIKFRTMSSAPSFPPRTDVGSFEITEIDDKNRDVFLYWQRIPQNHQNGENFTYEVDYVEKNGIDANLKNKNSTVAYVKYTIATDSKYLFKIASKNEVGPSNRSEIIVPTQSEVISLEPNAFTKIAYNETLYELSWKPPVAKNIKNYTIFWCEDTRDRPYQCTGYLDWVHVPKNTTMYNVTVFNPSKVYQFAISSNTERISSGMVWASCTVIHNKVTSKMKDVWINSIGSRSIEVGWKLDCSDRVGIIDGFNIYYCPIISPYQLQCQENTKKNITIVAGPHTIHGTAHGLQPYTTYMLYVTVLTKFGEGSNSDALYNTTLEDAPSTPPQDLQVVNVTNTTITLEWKPPLEMNGVLRYYEVQLNDRLLRAEDVLGIRVTDLEPYTKYNISVRACTISCSNVTSVEQMTEIGIPGKINSPYVYSTNGSEVILKWYQPKNSGGPVHYYEILLHNNRHVQYTNASEIRLSIPDCKDVNDPQEPSYLFRVRAVNIINETQLKGLWSDPVEVNCHSDGPSFAAWLMICITGIIGVGVFFSCLVYGSRRMWSKCRAMQDVEVKLPPGLAPNIKLLPNAGEQHIRQPSADSSGCSSAQDSVTSSLTTNSQVSNDSGTDMASDPASPDKLLESLPSWESKRVRQRNVGNARSTENAQWESYVKVAKSGEPVLGETLSLTRSTPNLTESAGCTTSQHTWSSTGYISMPSSEEASSNPSPVPRENPFIIGAAPGTATANYSVVGSIPKPVQSKPEDPVAGKTAATVSDALITLQTEATKSSKPYIAFSALEKKLKKSKHAADTLDLDELTFVEPDKCNNPDAQTPSQFDSDKISKPYVQTGLIDTHEKQYLLKPIVDTKRNLLCGSFMSTGSHGKPFAPASFLPSFPPTSESLTESPTESPSSSSKPYVAVSSISNEMAATSPAHAANESSSSRRPYVQHAIPAAANKLSSKPYTLASLQQQQQQRGKTELCARVTSDDESCKKVNADDKSSSVKVEPNRPVFAKQNTGYVTLAENPSLGKLKPAPTPTQKQLEKPAQQTPTTTSQSADGQYSKVTVVPSTM